MLAFISDKLLMSLGFKRERVWREVDRNFTLKYSIEGYSGRQIHLYAQYCAPSALSPEDQVEYASDIEHLIEYTGDWGYYVYVENHPIVSINFETELILLLSALKIDINNEMLLDTNIINIKKILK